MTMEIMHGLEDKKKKENGILVIMVQEKLKILKRLFFFNFKPGHRNDFNEVENENPLNKNENKIVGNGIYLAVDINEAKE